MLSLMVNNQPPTNPRPTPWVRRRAMGADDRPVRGVGLGLDVPPERLSRRDVAPGARRRVPLEEGEVRLLLPRVLRLQEPEPGVKKRVGSREEPKHSNYSDQSSVKILSELRRFCQNLSEIPKFSTCSRIFGLRICLKRVI